MTPQKEDSGNTMFLLVCLMIAVLLLLPAWYAARAGAINGALLHLAKAQLLPFTWFSDTAHNALGLIEDADPAALTWDQVMKVLGFSGKWIRWLYALVLVTLGAAAIFMGRTAGLVRRLNMDSLLKHNAESFACLRPIVGHGKHLLSPVSFDSGPWRIARTPVQFAMEHSLLLDNEGKVFRLDQALRHGLPHADLPAYGHAFLDEEKAEAVLVAQLGNRLRGFNKLSSERKALAAAFMAYAAGDKHGCLGLLDAVSTAYRETDAPACPVLQEPRFSKQMKTGWNSNKNLLANPLLKRHAAFELPWFMALLTLARRKGVLASSQFLWLRPLDRPLWYALNQCGGRAAWAEGFAAWAHYAAEEKAGRTLPEPRLAHAVTRLRETLAAQGWLADRVLHSALVDDDIVLAEAEDSPEEDMQQEYDANDDTELHQELL